MDYNEKLRLAKEALDSGSYDRETIEYIFPELAESEDEKIRKALIEHVKKHLTAIEGIDRADAIAWLEKQKPIKWSEEDEIGSDATIELLEYFINYAPEFRKPTIRRSIDWLKSLKKRMEEQQ